MSFSLEVELEIPPVVELKLLSFPADICGKTGDVQDNAVPAATAPKQTVTHRLLVSKDINLKTNLLFSLIIAATYCRVFEVFD